MDFFVILSTRSFIHCFREQDMTLSWLKFCPIYYIHFVDYVCSKVLVYNKCVVVLRRWYSQVCNNCQSFFCKIRFISIVNYVRCNIQRLILLVPTHRSAHIPQILLKRYPIKNNLVHSNQINVLMPWITCFCSSVKALQYFAINCVHIIKTTRREFFINSVPFLLLKV